MNADNHLVEDSAGRRDTSPHPQVKTQALLQLLLFCVLWSVSMGVVITVANVEVHIIPPVLYLCYQFSIRHITLPFKTGFSPDFASLWRKRDESGGLTM